MKNTIAIALLIAMLPIAAAAQLGTSQRITANVPFEFVAWERTLPAGNCILQRATMSGSVLAIANVKAGMSTFALSREERHKGSSGVNALVFRKYGTHHFLSQIKIADGTVYVLPETRLERELRAQNISDSEQVVLASLK